MSPDQIEPNKVYTTKETQDFLKVSESTMKRMIKSGIIEAYKVSGQYRIWGKEILKLLSPKTAAGIAGAYMKARTKIKKTIENW